MKPRWDHVFRLACAGICVPQKTGFFCFGTMLTLVRDKGAFKKRDDVDIGVFYDEFEFRHVENFCSSNGWVVNNRIVHDLDRKPLYIGLKPRPDTAAAVGDTHIDIFCWYEHDGIYWHTYDIHREKPHKGIPKKYTFKGIPAWALKGGFAERLNIGGSGHGGRIPMKYGTLLDMFYPEWYIPKDTVSEAPYVIEMNSCEGFKKGKYDVVKWDEKNWPRQP